MQDVGYKSQKGYSSFKMRPDLDFSSSVGHILPVLYDFLYPGDKVDVSFKLKTRTLPLDAAAYGEFRECIDTFFVPIEQLYHNFKNQIYGILDFDSDFFVQPSPGQQGSHVDAVPYISLTNLFAQIHAESNTTFTSPYVSTRFLAQVPQKSETLRLLDHLGLPIYSLFGAPSQVVPATTMSINFWNLLAYQKIWYDHYRITDRIDNDATAYNVDSFYNSNIASLPAADLMSRIRNICKMNYVPYDEDFYTKNYTSPIMGESSISAYPSTAIRSVNQWLSSLSSIGTGAPGTLGNAVGNNTNPTTVYPVTLASSFTRGDLNTANLRAIFASEKLLEITRRAGKHYDAQTLAHFGIKVPEGIAGESYFLGHHEQELVIGEVVSTSTSQITDPQGNLSTTPLGEIAGRGFSLGNSKNVRFSAPCHGILMSLFYIKPISKYKQTGLDRLNTLVKPCDYMNPAMDGLGMQPLFGYQTDFKQNAVGQNSIIGWQFRFMESKDKPKRVLGALAGSLDYWTFWKPSINSGVTSYYVMPTDVNNLFLLQWDGVMASDDQTDFCNVYDEIYDKDNFLHSLAIGYNKASKMSVSGMSSL